MGLRAPGWSWLGLIGCLTLLACAPAPSQPQPRTDQIKTLATLFPDQASFQREWPIPTGTALPALMPQAEVSFDGSDPNLTKDARCNTLPIHVTVQTNRLSEGLARPAHTGDQGWISVCDLASTTMTRS